MIKDKDFPLPPEFQIGCEIYWCNKHDIKCTTQRLLDTFITKHKYTKEKVIKTIDTLFDWSILKCDYDKESKERLYELRDDQTIKQFKNMYKHYWKHQRKISEKIKDIK